MLTARELIEQLQKIDPDTVPYMTDFDSEYGYTYVRVFERVDTDGYIQIDYRSTHPEEERIEREQGQ